MSILAAAGGQDAVAGDAAAGGVWFMALAAGAAVGIAALLGVLRGSKLGRVRTVPAGAPLAPLVGVTLAAAVVWLVLPTLYVTAGANPAASRPAQSSFSTREMVILNAAVPAIALAVLLVANVLVRPIIHQRIGAGARQAPGGVLGGIVGITLALPLVIFTMAVTTVVYKRVGFQPREHELLRAMVETPDRIVKIFAIVAAVVVAPLWEELLFRGHAQSLLREGFTRLRDARIEPLLVNIERPRPAESWAAVLLASALFAIIHPIWMFPPIFVLSVCLGIAYERSGNLWVPITMHAAFNGVMTVYFLTYSG